MEHAARYRGKVKLVELGNSATPCAPADVTVNDATAEEQNYVAGRVTCWEQRDLDIYARSTRKSATAWHPQKLCCGGRSSMKLSQQLMPDRTIEWNHKSQNT